MLYAGPTASHNSSPRLPLRLEVTVGALLTVPGNGKEYSAVATAFRFGEEKKMFFFGGGWLVGFLEIVFFWFVAFFETFCFCFFCGLWI